MRPRKPRCERVLLCFLGWLACCGDQSSAGSRTKLGVAGAASADVRAAAGAPAVVLDHCDSSPRTLVTPANVFGPLAGAESHSFIDIAVNATHIYYSFDSNQNTGVDGAVMRVPITGGVPARFAAVEGRRQSLLLTATSALFTQSHTDGRGGSVVELVQVPFEGGSPSVLVRSPRAIFETLAADGQNVYFADEEGTKSVSLAGGAVRLLTSETGTIALVGTNLIIAGGSREKPNEGKLVSVPTDGGAPTTIVSNQAAPHLPLSCGADLCWLTAVKGPSVIGGTGALVRYAAGEVPKAVIENSTVYFIRQLLSDGTDFFGAMFNDIGQHEGTPFRISGTSDTRTELLMYGGSIAIDDKCVYMASSVAGITSIAK